jgi:hypothetical protein
MTGRKTVENEPRSGRPASLTTSTNVDRVRALIHQDRRLTIRMIANELNECTVHQIATQDLIMRTACAKLFPENLNEDQNASRKEVSAEMLEHLETEPDFLNGAITGIEIWFFE